MVTCPVRVSASMVVDLKIEILTNTRGVSDVGFSIFADTDVDADFSF